VDYCLRLALRGRLCGVAAGARLRHPEGISRGGLDESADAETFSRRWASSLPETDHYSHPALAADRDDWMLDPTRVPVQACPIP
jgi:hypothetical protein